MNNINPKISIITASYNYEDYIKEAIESVMVQSYQDWELIIVDDGSKDNSLEVINSYAQKDARIKVFTHENNVNKGLIETIKLGLSNVCGDYVAFLESDDVWTKDYLEKKSQIIQQYPDTGLIFNSVEMFGCHQNIKEYAGYFELSQKILNKIEFPKNLFDLMLLINLVPTFSCVMVKKEAIDACSFDNLYGPWLDWGLWIQIAYRHDFYYIPKNLTKWRMHQKSYINTSDKIKRNNNKILYSIVSNTFDREQNTFKKIILTNYYYTVMLFFKITKGFIKKSLLKIL